MCALATQDMGYSRERVFVTPPAVGAGATTRFLVVADLGHAQLDGSEEVNFNHVRDNVTYNKNQSLQQARPRALVCRGIQVLLERDALWHSSSGSACGQQVVKFCAMLRDTISALKVLG